jgi:hypothetical protein
MTFNLPRVRPFNLLSLAALALGGCAGHSDFMTKVPQGTAAIAPTSNSATIAFIRDSGIGFAVNFSIIDQSGNLLGDAVARSHFALQLPPGRYFFFARGGENTDVVQADVAAGRLYYVRVVPHLGVWLARVELDPVKPNEREWGSLPAWLAKTDHLTPLIPKAAASVSASPLPDWASKAWSSLSPSNQAAHSLTPADGRPLSSCQPLAPTATVAASL